MVSKKPSTPSSRTKQTVISDPAKIPPQAIDLEEAVLGAIMLEKDAIFIASEILKKESFYKEANGEIYDAALNLSLSHEPVDLLTVTEYLRKKKLLETVGGVSYLSGLTMRVASSAHIEFHSRIIQQKYIQRELIRVSSEIQQQAYDESIDIDILLNESVQSVFEISQNNIKRDAQPVDVLLNEAVERIEKLRQDKTSFSGIQSGYTKLDRLTSGWQPSDMIILAARPSMGKTAFALSMTRNIALNHQKHVAIFSLEMSSIQLINRLIVAETEISAEKIRNGRLNKEEMEFLYNRVKNLSNAKLYIDDTPSISVAELRSKCQRLHQQGKLDIVIIDYLQLMTYGSKDGKTNREQEVAMISRSLKALARDLKIPVIALAQLNRGVENRTGLANKRPQLADLRESGSIEQDADLVMFIHRPEVYGFTEDDQGSLEGIAEVIVAKHRNGGLDDIRLRFRKEFARFDELTAGDASQYTSYPIDSFNSDDAPQYTTISSKMNSMDSNHFDMMPNNQFDDSSSLNMDPNNPPF